jgi:cation:H+ antiporter
LPTSLATAAFLIAAAVSLCTSWVLVSRLERVGERLGFSEGLLGVVAALAADAPEITAAITALAHRQHQVGAGVVIGSNIFNLAALLGLGAVVAGRISLHRRVVALAGGVALWVAGVCVAAVVGLVSAVIALVLALVPLVVYLVALGGAEPGLRRLRLPSGVVRWLGSAVAEEELELEAAIRPRRGTFSDAAVGAVSVAVVVAASIAMERAASTLGRRYSVPDIVIGGLVLAAVTSLPNAVAAVYLAARGRGAATLSTALNSNAANVVVGLLFPAAVIGLGSPSSTTTLIVWWYLGLTIFSLAFAYRDSGLRRVTGGFIIAMYGIFAVSLLVVA